MNLVSIMAFGCLILSGCRDALELEKSEDRALGHALPNLVFAAHAPVFDPGGAAYTEVVRERDFWKIHHGGAWRADCRSEDEIYRAMRTIWDENSGSRVLISAEADITFQEIRKLIQGVARAGFWRVDFLVTTGNPGGENHALCLKLPRLGWSPPELDPFFIRIDAQGVVSCGTGSARQLLDADPTGHALPKLSALLKIFAEAAKAANCNPYCQVYAHPDASYQRVIDLLSRFHVYGIEDMAFTDLIEERGTSTPLKSKPRAPSYPPLRPGE